MERVERYGHFIITKRKPIPEIQSTLIEAIHEPTGAHIMQIANDDDENLFNLSFRTYPKKSDGIAHILEHTVLCGSQKYPIRDPFFSMTRRSLNTFMNALTGADFTCYPASSQVPQDFYNLMEVYLDAVFKPKLSKMSFLQEGHRLEFLSPEDPNTPLTFKGIVFNEMKGAMAPGEARLMEALMKGLYPDITYGVNSGGDPKEIPDLTYEDLKAFHAKYYHPSRCLFYFYGNLPLEKHLDFLEKHAFQGVSRLPDLPQLPPQPRFKAPKKEVLHYPFSAEQEEEAKTLVGMGWLTCSILDQETALALDVLDVALTGTDASPLKKALLQSNLCKQADTAIESDMSELPFLVICKGCKEQSGEHLEKVVRSTLEKLVNEGVSQHLIDAAIHQIEMSRSEITGNSSPYGLSLFWRSALLKQHGGYPEDGLKIHTLFQGLRQAAQDPGYFPSLIHRYFLENPHFVSVEMRPDYELVTKELKQEEKKLQQIAHQLKDPDIRSLLEQAKEFSAYQESAKDESLDVLPKVTLRDVKKEGKEFHLHKEAVGPLKIAHHDCFTNEIVYADLTFDLPHIEQENLSLLRLFTLLLPQLGCGGRDAYAHLDYLLEHTGGIGVSLDLCLQADNPLSMRPSLNLRGKALHRKLSKLFPIFFDLVTSVDFTDQGRILELLKQHLNSVETSIQNNSLRYAVNLAARGWSVASTIMSRWYGLDYYYFLRDLVQQFEKEPAALINKLQQMQGQVLGLKAPTLILSCDEKSYAELKKESFYGLTNLPAKEFQPWKPDYPVEHTRTQARITASPVAFTASLFPSVPYTHPLAAAISVASEIMENETLHACIREQGGAYGSGAVHAPLSGHFYLYAYRDPHLKATLEAFRESIEQVSQGNFNDEEIEEAQLGLFQELDSPIPPASRAMTAYSRERGGRSPERRQHFRESLLHCTKEQIQKAATDILMPGFEKSVTVAFANQEFLERENQLLGTEALPIQPI